MLHTASSQHEDVSNIPHEPSCRLPEQGETAVMNAMPKQHCHGAAGTGKTLVARALAASASQAGRKVAFFMRKGADVLSKWAGEAERQLRLLFAEAQKAQPAIIFFDEIDGLAPVSPLQH